MGKTELPAYTALEYVLTNQGALVWWVTPNYNQADVGPSRGGTRTETVSRTDEGIRAVRQVRRRNLDGRYSLSFDTEYIHCLYIVGPPRL